MAIFNTLRKGSPRYSTTRFSAKKKRYARNHYLASLTLVIVAITLTACGGGTSTGAPATTTTHTVTAAAGTGGAITPGSSTVTDGSSISFTITPEVDFGIDTVSGCDGVLTTAGTYITGAISGDCSVVASFTSLAGNAPPVAIAGLDQIEEVGIEVTLDANASSDPETAALSYSWSLVSSPAGSRLASSVTRLAANPIFVFTPDVAGEFKFSLLVNDGSLSSQPANLTVTALASGGVFNRLDTAPIDLPIGTASISSTIDVSGGPVSISYLRVYLDMTHGYDQDLAISLTSPTGTVINLSSGNGAAGVNYSGTVFDDVLATQSVEVAAAPFNGLFLAEQALSGFNGEAADGSWTLTVVDSFVAEGDGVLNAWKIVFPDGAAPRINGAVDQIVALNSSVQLNADAADANGDSLSYSWAISSAPAGSAAVLSDVSLSNPTFSADLEGTYAIDLVVSDGTNSVSTVVKITAVAAVVFNNPDTSPIELPIGTASIASTITVSGGPLSISYVQVYLDMIHSYVEDLTITLTSPAGTVINLTSGNGGAGDNYRATIFDDVLATRSIGNSAAPFAGLYLPDQALSSFNGEAADGDWTLTVVDDYVAEDGGRLNTWKIVIPDNAPPRINGALDEVVALNSTVQLDADAADANGDSLSYSWVISSMPAGSSATLSNDSLSNPTFMPDIDGAYAVELVVSDGNTSVTAVAQITVLAAAIFTSNINLPIALPIGTESIASTITVSGGPSPITYLQVYLDMTHSYDKDLSISLTSPIGTVIDLTSANGGSGDHYSGTIFDDLLATKSVVTAAAPFIGLHLPEQALSGFNGEVADGSWTLTAVDSYLEEDGGVLKSWKIIFPDKVPTAIKRVANQNGVSGDKVQQRRPISGEGRTKRERRLSRQ